MSYSTALFGTIALLPLARGIAFGGPAPTATNPDRAVDGWTPKPTNGPSVAELRRRQSNLYPETCGWVDGDYSSAITCSIGRTCMLYTSADIGMAGCCDGSDTQECGWASSCVDYDAYTSSSCGTDCMLNSFVRKCTDAAAPYCVTWTYPSDGVMDYGCADYSSVETVYQDATDTDSYTTSMTLPTLSGNAVTFADETSTDTDTSSDFTDGSSDPTTTTDSNGSVPTTGLGNSITTSKKGKKKVSVALIIGVVVGALVLLFIVAAIVIFICVKKKKSKQLAANQEAVAAAQANRPQSQYPPQMQQQQPVAPVGVQSPQTQYNGYFGQQDQKINPQTQVHEYGMPSPASNPATPAPPYVQPYYAAPNAPPMPTQSPAPYPTREPTPGTHEVDAATAPAAHAPAAQPPAQSHQGPVYEIGTGR